MRLLPLLFLILTGGVAARALLVRVGASAVVSVVVSVLLVLVVIGVCAARLVKGLSTP